MEGARLLGSAKILSQMLSFFAGNARSGGELSGNLCRLLGEPWGGMCSVGVRVCEMEAVRVYRRVNDIG